MKGGWFALILLVYVVGIYFGATYAGYDDPSTWAGTGDGGYEKPPLVVLNEAFSQDLVSQKSSIYGEIQMVAPGEIFRALWQMALLRYDFIMVYPMLYQFVFLPFALISIYTMIVLGYQILTGNLGRS